MTPIEGELVAKTRSVHYVTFSCVLKIGFDAGYVVGEFNYD